MEWTGVAVGGMTKSEGLSSKGAELKHRGTEDTEGHREFRKGVPEIFLCESLCSLWLCV